MRFLEHRDHPREYGENNGTGESAGVGLGPSPRIRGELTELLGNTSLTGTIPANTGRMVPATEETQVWRDHPREYGENPHPANNPDPVLGPSPRIRGELALPDGMNIP